ncbi:MAG: hypothetical protein SNG10_01305 [Rikenellaceae bacterium]
MFRTNKLILIIVCAFAVYTAKAQQCEYRYLESIYEKLPSAIKTEGGGDISGFSVEMTYNGDGVVSTLGVRLPIFDGDSTLVSQFAKRYFLDLILTKSDLDIKNVLDRNKSKLYFNGAEYQVGPYWNLHNGLSILNRSVSYEMKRDSLEYRLVWKDSDNSILALKFPANIQILTGRDKLELESEIESLFTKDFEAKDISEILNTDSLYTKLESGVYAKIGESFLIDSMSSTTYYTRKKANKYEFVYSPDMLGYSLVNLLLRYTKYGDKTTINVEQRMYGNSVKTFKITTNSLREFCETNGFDPYIGVESCSDDRVEATVILHNKELNYIHMFHVATDVNSLFGSKDSFISARLFSYIPFDNVADIFDEYKNETKEKIKL